MCVRGCRLGSCVFLKLAKPRRACSSECSLFPRPRALPPASGPRGAGPALLCDSAIRRFGAGPRRGEPGAHSLPWGSVPRAVLQMRLLCIKGGGGGGAAAHDICSRPGFRFESHIRAGLTLPKGIWMWAECTMLTMLIAAWNGIFAARKSSSSSAASLGPGRHQPRGRLSAQEGGTRGSGLDAQIFPPPSPHPDPGGAHLGTAPPRPKASPDLGPSRPHPSQWAEPL